MLAMKMSLIAMNSSSGAMFALPKQSFSGHTSLQKERERKK